ncbi:hypothetical protein [Crocosphaera sp.]|uniref:hypothetical protein n=1 Tax=Crocosphaera sp. TaxID=2729996 RepID=UPI003F216155|nr:hypothetical protein [Crocosphaera sp.]
MKQNSSEQLVRVHRRQFIVGPREFLARSDWHFFPLGNSLVLSTDPDLRVSKVVDLDGTTWFILGIAVDTRPEYSTPLEELKKVRTQDITSLYEGWAGRWILVSGEHIHPDASAMLGCYYGRDTDGNLWASSSPTLIETVLKINQSKTSSQWQPSPHATVTGKVRGISWYPPPHSKIPGVSRLLPTQILDLTEGIPKSRPLVMPMTEKYKDQEIYAILRTAIQTAIEGFATLNAPDDLTLLLSGGRDSRVLLSVASAAGIPLNTFTRIHRRASLADRILPARLSKITGYSHNVNYQRQEIEGRREAILAHAGYNVSWLSAEEFLRGGSDPLRGIALAGFCAALGRDRLMPVSSATEATGKMIAEHFCEGESPQLIAAFDAWLEWRRNHQDDDPCVNLYDYFFIEQRTGGRKGIKEQIFDLFPVERVPPLNSARIFSLICHLSSEAKIKALWIPEIIKATKPELLADPMNPPNSYFGFFRNKLHNLRSRFST